MMMENFTTIGPIREMGWESIMEPFQSFSSPNWEDVETKIRQLESTESGSVFLKATNGSTLSIGGDRGKGYIVFVSDKNGDRYLQTSSFKRKGTIELVIGFQPAEYPCRVVVDLLATLKAARAYFDHGCIEDNEDWTFDGRTIER